MDNPDSFFPLSLVSLALNGNGEFFPPSYRKFSFAEGDMIALPHPGEPGMFILLRCLKVEEVFLKKGETILIGKVKQLVTLPVDDSLLVCGFALSRLSFNSLGEAQESATKEAWAAILGHFPARTVFVDGGIWVGNFPVEPYELTGYQVWKKDFELRIAGIY